MKIRVYAIIKKESDFLLVRESNPLWKHKWYLPGGVMKTGEHVNTTAIREAREETGYDIALNGICFFKYHQSGHSAGELHIFVSGRVVSGELKKEIDEHSFGAAWLDMNAIEQLETRCDLIQTLNSFQKDLPMISTDQVSIY
jgi:ADP-ribose pyrophosphatase YjhB (NUDIX family)